MCLCVCVCLLVCVCCIRAAQRGSVETAKGVQGDGDGREQRVHTVCNQLAVSRPLCVHRINRARYPHMAKACFVYTRSPPAEHRLMPFTQRGLMGPIPCNVKSSVVQDVQRLLWKVSVEGNTPSVCSRRLGSPALGAELSRTT